MENPNARRVGVRSIAWLDGSRSISLSFLLLLISEMTIIHEDATRWLLARPDLDEIKRAILREAACICKGEDAEICSVLSNDANL